MGNISDKLSDIIQQISELSVEEKVEAINTVKLALYEISPFSDEPVDCVIWVKTSDVKANDYNPNSVAPPEMRLLKHSIECDGVTQPLVTHFDNKTGREIVDGFHRHLVCKKRKGFARLFTSDNNS